MADLTRNDLLKLTGVSGATAVTGDFGNAAHMRLAMFAAVATHAAKKHVVGLNLFIANQVSWKNA